jgi:hypothetical protein
MVSSIVNIQSYMNNMSSNPIQGFACPIQNFVQHLCCGTDDEYYCCSPDVFFSEQTFDTDQIYLSGSYQSTSNSHSDWRLSSMNHSSTVHRYFQVFEKFFLPIFLLTSTVIFLIGIAIWFWLYKHKALNSLDHDDRQQQQQQQRYGIVSKRLTQKKRQCINLTLEESIRRLSYPSTEV